LKIDDRNIVWRPYSLETNWTALVARAVDDAGGQGWVTEFAGDVAPFLELARSSFVRTEEQMKARDALVGILDGPRYMKRLYTRLSDEEMTSDPTFRRTEGGDVSREHKLPRYVNGEDLCKFDVPPVPNPCDFATCGSAGLCRAVEGDAATQVAGCACVPGTT